MLLQCEQSLRSTLVLANINTLGLEVNPGLLYLRLQFIVCLGDVVEGEDSQAELEEEICAERNEGPEGDLVVIRHVHVGIHRFIHDVQQAQPPSESSRAS